MAEYKIKGGHATSEEKIERLGEACDGGDYPGEPEQRDARQVGQCNAWICRIL